MTETPPADSVKLVELAERKMAKRDRLWSKRFVCPKRMKRCARLWREAHELRARAQPLIERKDEG